MSIPVALGTVIDERYRVDRVIGEGGMGVVMQATHLVLAQPVAIKFLRQQAMGDADAVRRFVREAQAAAKVQSEHIVRVHDVAVLPNGAPYLVMEYVEGEVLSSMLSARGPLPIREAVRYAVQICEALAMTHAAGIVHGDLKPENIYIAGFGDSPRRVKLLDFGISKILYDEPGGHHDVLMGTPAYMAPEQFETGTVQACSDIWALGAVLYEMLAGAPPFLRDSPDEIRAAVMSEPVAPIGRPDMPPGLYALIQLCLKKDPAERWSSAAELAAALEEHAPLESTAQRLISLPPPPTVRTSQKFVPTVVLSDRRKGHGTWAVAAIGMAIVGLVLLLVGAMRHLRTTPDWSAAQPPPAAPAIPAVVPPVAGSAPRETAAAPETTSAAAASTSAAPSSASVVLEGSKRTASPPKRPRTSPRGGARPPATTDGAGTAAPPPDDGDRFGTRK